MVAGKPAVGVIVMAPVYVPGARLCTTEVLIRAVTASGGVSLSSACSQLPPLVVFALRPPTVVPEGTVSVEGSGAGKSPLPAVYANVRVDGLTPMLLTETLTGTLWAVVESELRIVR
jgi:hypothetical protein